MIGVTFFYFIFLLFVLFLRTEFSLLFRYFYFNSFNFNSCYLFSVY